jgi:hypothetical protein
MFEYKIDVHADAKPKPLPDHYVGDVQIKTSSDVLLRVPVDINVRTGPGGPLIVLFCGILLGRLIKYMKDKGGPQSDLLLQVYEFEGRIAGSPDDQKLLQPMVQSVKEEIYATQLDQARTEFTAVENRWTLLGTLRSLEQTLEPRASEAGVRAILDSIGAVRGMIALKKDQDAATAVGKIEAAVQSLASQPGAPVPAFALAAAQAKTAQAAAGRSAYATIKASPIVRILSLVTGLAQEVRAEVSLWVLRPIGYLLLIAALMAIGLQQLYLKNPTFGVDPFSDYFGVFIWAMSSDVASRTLSNLKTT